MSHHDNVQRAATFKAALDAMRSGSMQIRDIAAAMKYSHSGARKCMRELIAAGLVVGTGNERNVSGLYHLIGKDEQIDEFLSDLAAKPTRRHLRGAPVPAAEARTPQPCHMHFLGKVKPQTVVVPARDPLGLPPGFFGKREAA